MRLMCLAVLAALAVPQLAAAQSLQFTSKGSDKPITVTADGGLTWKQDEKLFIADGLKDKPGSAQALQEDTQVNADQLVAHYRDKPKVQKVKAEGDETTTNEVYRVDAIGHVTIKTKGETATGEAAVYDFDRKVLVLQGNPVSLVAADGNVTAHRTLQYWLDENVAVAEGDAVAVDTTTKGTGRKVRGDKITAFFRDTPEKKAGRKSDKSRDLIYLQGVGNVVLTTKTQTVQGARGNYNVETGDVLVEGGVKMQQGSTFITGNCAIGNVNGVISIPGVAATGACAPGRVRALIAPKAKTGDSPTPAETKH